MFRSDTPGTAAPKERIDSYGTMSTPPPGTKKHRLSRLLGGTKEEQSASSAQSRPTAMNQPDSAYASSENAGNDVIQVENDGSIPNTNRGQNLALDRGTGEVFDEDTGEVVTVVTTTTTTTTTTTHRGKQQQQDVRRDVQTTQQDHPAGASTTTTTGAAPANVYTQAQPDSGYYSSGAPDLTTRNTGRSSEYDYTGGYMPDQHNTNNPASPAKQNFSYPGRNAPHGTATGLPPEQEVATKRSGRFADLKAAAIGLHGVGETLRGTLNSSIDQRYAPRDPNKAAAINAKNAAVLDRGRNEMAHIPQSRRDHVPHGNQSSHTPQATPSSGYAHQPTNPTTHHDNIPHQTQGSYMSPTTAKPTHHDSITHGAQSSYTSPTGGSTMHRDQFAHNTQGDYASPTSGSNTYGGQSTYGTQGGLSQYPTDYNTHGDRYTHGTQGGLSHHPTDSSTRHGSLPPDPDSNLKGTAKDGSHSAVFGLTPDGHRHLDTSPTLPRQSANDVSSVSNLDSDSGLGNSSLHAPRATTARADSGNAPESLSGHVERGPSTRYPESGITPTTSNQAAAMSGQDYTHPPPEGGAKKQGTLSKLFKRKPVGGEERREGGKYY